MNPRYEIPQPAADSRSLAPTPLGGRRDLEKGREFYQEGGACWLISCSPDD